MIIRIDSASAVPLYEQIFVAMESQILEGKLKPGDSLPAARHLASALQVNMHTVLKAYERLKAAGVIEVRRGRIGAVVAEIEEAHTDQTVELEPMVAALVEHAKEEGVERRRLLQMIGDAW